MKVLGTNAEGTSVKMTTEVLSKTAWETVYEEDDTLPAGTEQVKVTPYGGAKVKSYRSVYDKDGKLLSGSSAVYKGVADGEYAVGCTFEEGGAKYVADVAPVKLIYMKEGVISKPDGIYIIKNAKHMENAKKFIDFATSAECVELGAKNGSYQFLVVDGARQPQAAIDAGIDKVNVMDYDFDDAKKNTGHYVEDFTKAVNAAVTA